MSKLTTTHFKRALLEVLSKERHAHKFNLIGREFQAGTLEYHLDAKFDPDDRALAARAFEELRRDGYLQATYRDTTDPENWVEITLSGKEFLRRDLKDEIDIGLERISPHLVELRMGMWDAVDRTSPDAARHAAHSARELLAQLLKEGAPPECKTRKERFRFLMQLSRDQKVISKSDLEIIEAHCEVVEVEHNKLVGSSHSRLSVGRDEVLASVAATERILGLIFRVESAV
jgi:hypothetical protein